MANAAQQAANVRGAFKLIATPPRGTGVLLDDRRGSGWTLAMVGGQLRRAGAERIVPLVSPRCVTGGAQRGSADRPLLAARLAAQRLSGTPAVDVVAATRHLLAVQGQDPRAARLALRARTAGGHASAVDRALTDERSLIITWVNRGTLHLIAAEDEPLLHALTTPQLRATVSVGCDRRA